MGFQLPTSTGDRRISAINSSAFQQMIMYQKIPIKSVANHGKIIASIHQHLFWGSQIWQLHLQDLQGRQHLFLLQKCRVYGIHEFVMDRLDSIRTSPTLRFVGPRLFMGLLKEIYTIPETNMAPENGWLEY